MDSLLNKLTEARERALQKSRPTVLEVATYRYYGFSVSDANHKKYRTPEEIEFHKEHRDPIRHWADQLTNEGFLTPEIEKEMHETAKAEALAASDFAEASPPPLPQTSSITSTGKATTRPPPASKADTFSMMSHLCHHQKANPPTVRNPLRHQSRDAGESSPAALPTPLKSAETPKPSRPMADDLQNPQSDSAG